MAGKIQWQLEFIGLDVALAKLHEIDRVLSRITRNQGTVFLGQPGGGGPRNVVPPIPRSGAASTVAGLAGAGGTAALVSSLTAAWRTAFSYGGQGGAGGNAGGTGIRGGLNRFGNLGPLAGRDIGRPLPPPKGFLDLRSFRNEPPIIDPIKTAIRKFFSDIFENLGKGVSGIGKGGMKGFEALQKNMTEFGKGLQATGIPGITQIGGLLVKFGKLGAVVALVAAAAFLLYQAFKVLMEGVRIAAEEYRHGAASGVGINKASQLRQALKSIGITEEPTYQMRTTSGTAGIIGAARASGFGGAQQLQNMAKEFERAMADAASSSRQMEISALSGQRISQDWENIIREFKTMLAEFAANMYPVLHVIFQTLQDYLKLINLYLELMLRLKQWISEKLGIKDLFPKGLPGTANWPTQGGMPHVGAWEKLGFTFGRGGPTAVLDKINDNTKKSSETLNSIYEYVKILMRSFGGPMAPAAQFLP